MPTIQAVFFLLANGNEIPNCSVDSSTKLRAEIILSSQYGSSPEEITNMVISIADSSGNALHCFTWDGDCALKGGSTYTIDTPIFGPLPAGTYSIKRAFGYGPLTKNLPECGINLTEVSCGAAPSTPTTPTTPPTPSPTPTSVFIETYRGYTINYTATSQGFFYTIKSPSGISLGGYDTLVQARARIDAAIAAGG